MDDDYCNSFELVWKLDFNLAKYRPRSTGGANRNSTLTNRSKASTELCTLGATFKSDFLVNSPKFQPYVPRLLDGTQRLLSPHDLTFLEEDVAYSFGVVSG